MKFFLHVHSAQSIFGRPETEMNLDRVFVNIWRIQNILWFIITRFLVITVYTTKYILVNIHLRIKRGKFGMHKEEKQGHPWTERSARLKQTPRSFASVKLRWLHLNCSVEEKGACLMHWKSWR